MNQTNWLSSKYLQWWHIAKSAIAVLQEMFQFNSEMWNTIESIYFSLSLKYANFSHVILTNTIVKSVR